MSISIRHEIKAMIDDQFSYIAGLINSHPRLSEDWRNDQYDKFQNIARENSDGDKEIERNIYHQLINSLENSYVEESIFNNSMFLIVYSYYEGILNKIVIKEKIEVFTDTGKSCNNPTPKIIIKTLSERMNIGLSEDVKECIDFIEDYRIVRRFISHNNGVTDCMKETEIIEYARNKKEIVINDGVLYIIDINLINKLLDSAYTVLSSLTAQFNYKK